MSFHHDRLDGLDVGLQVSPDICEFRMMLLGSAPTSNHHVCKVSSLTDLDQPNAVLLSIGQLPAQFLLQLSLRLLDRLHPLGILFAPLGLLRLHILDRLQSRLFVKGIKILLCDVRSVQGPVCALTIRCRNRPVPEFPAFTAERLPARSRATRWSTFRPRPSLAFAAVEWRGERVVGIVKVGPFRRETRRDG